MSNTNFAPLFTGELLRLTPPQSEDQTAFARWAQDADYLRMLDDDPIRPLPASSFGHFGDAPKDDDYYFHLRTIEDDVLVGFVVLFNLKWRNQTAELAIGIGDADYRGKGYGRDALRLILNFGFSELNLRRISLTVMEYNASAIKAYERVGFVREGAHRQAVVRDGRTHDLVLYGILRDEWKAGNNA